MKHALSLIHLSPELTTYTGEKIAPGVHAFGRAGLTLNFGLFSGSKHPYPFRLTTQQPRKHSPQKAFTQHAVKQPKESQLQTGIPGYKRMHTITGATLCGGAVAGIEQDAWIYEIYKMCPCIAKPLAACKPFFTHFACRSSLSLQA